MVLNARPDFADYARGGIANWRDFTATASLVRSVLAASWLDGIGQRGCGCQMRLVSLVPLSIDRDSWILVINLSYIRQTG
jgi:hypothetical protein